MEGFSYDRKSILEKYDSTPTANSTNLVESGKIKTYVDTEVDSIDAKVDAMIDRVGNPFTFKGTVSTLSNLPSTGNTTNDTYFVEAEGFMYTWNGSSFTKSSSDVNNQLARDIATEYSTTKSNYKKGDLVLYNNQTYVRKEDATGAEGTFVTANWTAVSIADHLVTFKGEVEDDLTNLKSALEADFDINELAYNIEKMSIPENQITAASANGVTVTLLGGTKFKLNGTVGTSTMILNIDWELVDVEVPLYFLIKRNDGLSSQTGVWLHISYFDNNNNSVDTVNNIDVFNDVVKYSYPSGAVKTRNFFRAGTGSVFNNVEFEIIIMKQLPFDRKGIEESVNTFYDTFFKDGYNFIPLTWNDASGYWANNDTFASYSNIHTATIDVVPGETYNLTARNYYGMVLGVFYRTSTVSGNIVQHVFVANDDTWANNIDIVVPDTAEHLLLQQYHTNRATIYKKNFNNIVSNPLAGKLIAYNGDSICECRFAGNAANGGAYAKLISDITGCKFENRAVSGGVLASAVPNGDAPARFVVSDVTNMTSDADLICFEGGLNDFYRDVPLGDYTADDYTGNTDTTTVCGALESIFRQAIVKWIGKPICFVIVHRCWSTKQPNNAGYTFAQMRTKMIGICEKYSIPYYDAYTKSGLNAYNPDQTTNFLTAGASGEPDGMHPNESAYKKYYVPQLIKLFESLISVNEES